MQASDILKGLIWAAGALAVIFTVLRTRRAPWTRAAVQGVLCYAAAAGVLVAIIKIRIGGSYALFYAAHACATGGLIILPSIISAACLADRFRSRGTIPVVLCCSAIFLFAFYAYEIEPNGLLIEHITIETPKLARGTNIVIGQVSDAQFERFSDRDARALAALKEAGPDIIVFTGDLAQRADPQAIDDGHRFLVGLGAAAPAFAVTGDVECGMRWAMEWPSATAGFRAMAEGTRVRILANEVIFPRQNFAIAGVDHETWIPIGRLLANTPDSVFRLVIVHNPDIVYLPGANQADLILAGHTHGGQVCLPGGFPISTMTVLGRAYASGLHRVAGTTLYINRGLGMERGPAPPIRTFCPPEVAIIRIVGTG